MSPPKAPRHPGGRPPTTGASPGKGGKRVWLSAETHAILAEWATTSRTSIPEFVGRMARALVPGRPAEPRGEVRRELQIHWSAEWPTLTTQFGGDTWEPVVVETIPASVPCAGYTMSGSFPGSDALMRVLSRARWPEAHGLGEVSLSAFLDDLVACGVPMERQIRADEDGYVMVFLDFSVQETHTENMATWTAMAARPALAGGPVRAHEVTTPTDPAEPGTTEPR